jgi:hypothetical protein
MNGGVATPITGRGTQDVANMFVGVRPIGTRRRAKHEHAAAFTGRFASRQQQTAGTPGEDAAAFDAPSRGVSSRRAVGFLWLRRNRGHPVRMEDTS